jgi:hypothetical protein
VRAEQASLHCARARRVLSLLSKTPVVLPSQARDKTRGRKIAPEKSGALLPACGVRLWSAGSLADRGARPLPVLRRPRRPRQREQRRCAKHTHPFCDAIFAYRGKPRSFYQDRLGTNMALGKTRKKRWGFRGRRVLERCELPSGAKKRLLERFLYQKDHFTKTGSG